jgi:hypothetical protein
MAVQLSLLYSVKDQEYKKVNINMNNKTFNEIKLKMVMKIHGLSRRSAKEKIRKETSASYNNIGRDNDNLLTADDLFRS